MEKNVLRIASVMIIFVVLVPAVSMAESQFVSGAEHPVKPVATRSEGGVLEFARILALLREVLGNWAGDEACTDAPCQKDLENRVGIDPNGNS
jgi:hypothetical protein